MMWTENNCRRDEPSTHARIAIKSSCCARAYRTAAAAAVTCVSPTARGDPVMAIVLNFCAVFFFFFYLSFLLLLPVLFVYDIVTAATRPRLPVRTRAIPAEISDVIPLSFEHISISHADWF